MTPRLRRLIAIALLLLVIALPYHLVIRPIIQQHRDYDVQIADSIALIRQFRRSTATLDALRAEVEALEQQPALQTGYLGGETEALAAAELQNLVKVTIEAAGGVVNSTQVLPAEPSDGFRRITARVSMTGPIDSIFQAFHRLESMEPMLFLDNIDMGAQSRRRRRPRGRGGEEVAEDPTLNANFDVYGYMRGV